MTTRRKLVAMGDPQAPFERVMEVLRANSCLGQHDKLAGDVHLVVMGDYFDYGAQSDRADAAAAAAKLLGWFVSHAEEQVTLLLGNHDLARIGELLRFDDATFARAQTEADAGYYDEKPQRPEEEFKQEFDVPGWELVARDFTAFRERQKKLVVDALSAKRLRAAYAPAADTLMVHAGVTQDNLQSLGIPAERDARIIAQRLNRALYEAFDLWRSNPQAPFFIPGLHAPGSQRGEGTGIFYHRPSLDAKEGDGRRFHPSRLPTGLMQVIGHIGDKKCRELLEANPEEAKNGPIRHLSVKGSEIRYARGLPQEAGSEHATVIFIDGTLRDAEPSEYELYRS